MNEFLALIPQFDLTPGNIAAAAIITGIVVIMLSCALAGILHKPAKNDIRKWG